MANNLEESRWRIGLKGFSWLGFGISIVLLGVSALVGGPVPLLIAAASSFLVSVASAISARVLASKVPAVNQAQPHLSPKKDIVTSPSTQSIASSPILRKSSTLIPSPGSLRREDISSSLKASVTPSNSPEKGASVVGASKEEQLAESETSPFLIEPDEAGFQNSITLPSDQSFGVKELSPPSTRGEKTPPSSDKERTPPSSVKEKSPPSIPSDTLIGINEMSPPGTPTEKTRSSSDGERTPPSSVKEMDVSHNLPIVSGYPVVTATQAVTLTDSTIEVVHGEVSPPSTPNKMTAASPKRKTTFAQRTPVSKRARINSDSGIRRSLTPSFEEIVSIDKVNVTSIVDLTFKQKELVKEKVSCLKEVAIDDSSEEGYYDSYGPYTEILDKYIEEFKAFNPKIDFAGSIKYLIERLAILYHEEIGNLEALCSQHSIENEEKESKANAIRRKANIILGYLSERQIPTPSRDNKLFEDASPIKELDVSTQQDLANLSTPVTGVAKLSVLAKRPGYAKTPQPEKVGNNPQYSHSMTPQF